MPSFHNHKFRPPGQDLVVQMTDHGVQVSLLDVRPLIIPPMEVAAAVPPAVEAASLALFLVREEEQVEAEVALVTTMAAILAGLVTVIA